MCLCNCCDGNSVANRGYTDPSDSSDPDISIPYATSGRREGD